MLTRAACLLLVALPSLGMVLERDGVMTPEKFFHAGPVRGWRKR